MVVPQIDNKGVALLLAVAVISLLMAVTVQFNRDMRDELTGSANLLDSTRLAVTTKSGYNIGIAVLAKDIAENSFDSILDSWAALENEQLADIFGGSSNLIVKVADLSGRFQLNSLIQQQGGGTQAGSVNTKSKELFERLLLSGRFGDLSQEQAEGIVYAVIDWIDSDDMVSGIEETESSYYLSRQPAYACKNGPMEFIEELLLVRGITSDLYYGNDEFIGLRDVVTVHGDDGKININTAPAAALVALSGDMTDELAENMISFREDSDKKALLESPDWYKSVPDVPGYITIDSDTITTVSSFFRLRSAAERDGMERILEAVVQRNTDGSIEQIYRKVE